MSGPQGYRETQMRKQMEGMLSEVEAKIDVPESRTSLEKSMDIEKMAREMAELQQENHFLRSYAIRLEKQLQVYQSSYPELDVKIPAAEPLSSDLPPWVASAKFMNPLLVAYQRKIDDLTQRNEAYFTEVKDIKERFEAISKSPGGGEETKAPRIVPLPSRELVLPSAHAEELNEAMQRTGLLRQQVEVLEKQNGTLNDDLAKEREELEDLRIQTAQAEATIKHLMEQKRRHDEALSVYAADKEELDNRLAESLTQIQALDGARQQLKTELKAKAEEVARHIKNETALRERADKLASEAKEDRREREKAVAAMASLEAQLMTEQQSVSQLRYQLRERERRVQSLTQKCAQADSMLAAARKAGEAQRVELLGFRRNAADSKLERDKVMLAEKSAREEAARVSARCSADLERFRKEAKEAQEALFSANKAKVAALERRVKDMQLEAASQKEAADSAQRQLSSTQRQLEMITRTGMEMQARVSDEANKAKAEGRRLETKLQLQAERSERLEKQIQDGEGIWAAQRAKMLKEAKRVRGALDQKGLECRTLAGEVKMLREQSQNMITRTEALEESAKRTEQSLQERLEDLETQHRKEIDEMSARLEEAYKMHDEAERRGEQSLIEQTGITKKWKQHFETTSTRMRAGLNQAREELNSWKSRSSNLEAQTTQLIADREQAQLFHVEYEKRCQHLELVVAALKSKHAAVSSQLTAALAREPALVEEVKRLQGTLDENDAEKQRLITEKNQALRKLELFDQGKTVDLVETLTSLADDARGGEDPLLIGTSVLSPSRDAYPRGEPLAPLDIEGFESDDGNVAKNHLNFSAAAGGNGAEDDLLRVSAEEYKQVIKELGDAGRT